MEPKPDKKQCEKVASILKAIANPQRLYILCSLSQGEKTVGELEKICETSQSVVSQHLTRMRLEGFLESRRQGNFVYYQIIDKRILPLIKLLKELFCKIEDTNS